MRRVLRMAASSMLALMALLTGCTRPPAAPPAPTSSQPAATATAKPAGGPIKIGYSPWPGWFVWSIVKEKKLFEKHGVNAELVWFPVYSDSLQALATGQIDGNSQTLSDTLAPASKDIKLKAVLVNDNSAGGDGLVATDKVKSLADLKGKTVATELGTVDHLLLITALSRVGLTEKDINFVNMTVNDAGPAFISGQLDAAVLWEPFLGKAIGSGKGRLIFSSRDTPGLIPDLLVLKEKVVQERREDVKRILRAWFDALDFWRQNPDEALAIMAKAADTTVAEFQAGLDGVKIFSLADNLTAFRKADDLSYLGYTGKKTAEFLKAVNMLEKVPDVEALLDGAFVQALAAEKK